MQPEVTRRIVSISLVCLCLICFHCNGFLVNIVAGLGSEVNRLDFAPLYDTIILSDVADIINEFENNMVSVIYCLVYLELMNKIFFIAQTNLE